jgi:hypothetical protein
VETRLRPGAQVVVETAAEGHPVLASWELGLGRVSALTTEPAGAGTSAWSTWDGLGPLLARTLERTTRPSEAFRFSATRDGHEVLLRARHTGLAGAGRPAAALLGSEPPSPLAFERVAPGHFEARVTAAPDLELRLTLGPAGRGALVVPPAQAPELNVDPEAALDLEVLAAGTGGTHARVPSLTAGLPAPAAGGADDPLRLRDLRPLLLGLALLTYLAEVLLRRLDRRAAPAPTARA